MYSTLHKLIATAALALILAVLSGSSAQAGVTNWTGNTSAVWNLSTNWDNGIPTATNDAVFPATIPGTGATITVAAGMIAQSITFNGTYTLTGGDITLSPPATSNLNVAATKTGTISSVLGGAIALGINGTNAQNATATTGTLVLAGANTYTLTTTITAGTVSVTNATGLGSATGGAVTVSSGAELAVNAALTIATKNVSFNGTGVSGSVFTINNNTTWSGTITASTASTVSVATGATLTCSNAVPITATGLLTKSGAGTMSLTGAGISTGTGGTTVSGGVLAITGTTTRLDSGNIIVNSGGTLRLTGTGTDGIGDTRTITVVSGGVLDLQQTGTETINKITIEGTGIGGTGALINGGNTALGVLTVTNGIVLTNAMTINTGTGTGINTTAAFSGAFPLSKLGSGTIITTGANSCSGLNVLAGTFSGRAGAGVNPFSASGQTITLGDTANPATAVTLENSTNVISTFNNPIVTAPSSTATHVINDPSGANITFSGAITLNGANLKINNSNGQASSFLTFSGGVNGTGNLTLNGTGSGGPINFTVNPINMVGTISNIGTVSGGIATINSVITNSVTGITQSGVAPLLLGGNNTFAGPVTVTGGSLDVTSTGTLPGAVTATAANLSGAGTINGAVTLNGSNPTLTPGDFSNNGNGINANGVGTLTVANNVTFSTPGTLTMQLGASGSNDKIVTTGTGNVVFAAGSTINLVAATGFDPTATYTLVNTSGGTGTISNASTLNIVLPGYTVTSNQATATNTLTVGPFTFAGAASQLNWKGGAGTDLATAANWVEGVAPTAVGGPYELIFGATGAGPLTNTMPAGTTVMALTFTSGGYTLTGNSLTLLSDANSTNSPAGTGISFSTGSGANAVVMPLVLQSSSANIAVGTGAAMTVGGVVSSTGVVNAGLAKSGAGTLTILGANTYVGGFTMNGGTLNINNATALGTIAGTFNYNGGTIDNTSPGAVVVGAMPVVLGGNVNFTGSNALTLGGTVALGGNRNVTVNASNLSLTGAIGGTGFSLTKLGVGILTMGSVTNTYSGGTTITAGVLSIPTATAIPAGTVTTIAGLSAAQPATLSYSAGSASDLAAGSDLNLGTVSNANIIDVSNAGGTLQMRTPNSTVTTPSSANSNRITGGANGIVAYIKTGPGAFASDSGNSNTLTSPFLGDVKILGGTLTSCQSSTTLANTHLFGSGTLFLGDTAGSANTTINSIGTSPGDTLKNNVVVVAGNSGTSKITCTNTGAPLIMTGNLTVNKDLLIFGTAGGGQNFSYTTGTLTGSGNISVQTGVTTAAQSFTFSNAGGFGGNFNVLANGTTGGAILVLGATNSFPTTCNINLVGSAGAALATFRTNGFSNTVGSITGNANSQIHNLSANPSTLTVGNDNTSTAFAGTIINGSTGVLNIVKQGSGTWTLSGIDTYTGTTAVNGTGSLIINGAETTTGVKTVNSGAILGGTGSTTGSVTATAGGIINPGAVTTPGTFKSAGLTLDPNSIMNFRLNGASNASATGTWPVSGNDYYDLTAAGGQVIQGTINISGLTGLQAAPNNVYRLFTTTGTAPVLGTLNTNLFLNMPPGYSSSTLAVVGTTVELTVVADGTQLTWVGGTAGAVGDISVATNWSPNAVPTATSNLLFTATGTNQSSLVNNGVAGVNSMTFTGGNYTLASGTQNSLALPGSTATFTPMSVVAGTQIINTDVSFAAPTSGTAISVASGATLTLGTGTNNLISNSLLTISSLGTTLINSAISGTAVTVSNGTGGTVTLAGTNTYTGATTINSGTVKTGNVAAFGSTGPVTVANGAVLDLAGLTGTLSGPVPITINGNGTGTGALINSAAGTPTVGTVTLGNASALIGIANGTVTTGNVIGGGFGLTVNGAGNLTIAGNIDATTTTVNKSGTGTLTLSGSNAYAGSTTVSAGTLVFTSVTTVGGGNSALGAPTTVANGTIVLGAATLRYTGTGSTSDRAVALNAASATIDASGSGLVSLSGGVTGAGAALTLTGTGSGSIGAVATAAGTVTKTGAGAWTLSGINTYSGATTVDNGSLVYSGGAQTLAGTLTFGLLAGNTNACNLTLTNSAVTFNGLFLVRTTTANNTLNIDAASTLICNNSATIGVDLGGATNTATNLAVSGAGTLTINNLLLVGLAQAAATSTNTGALDLSALANFNATVSELRVGYGQTVTGFLNLAQTSNSINASAIRVGDSLAVNAAGTPAMTLGAGTNLLVIDTLAIGLGKANGTVSFGGNATGSVTILPRTTAGTAIDMADNTQDNNTGFSLVSTLDLSGHTANVAAGSVIIAKRNDTAGTPGFATGLLKFSSGSFSSSSVVVCSKTGTTAAATATTGTLTISGGLFTVNSGGSFNLVTGSGTGSCAGTLNLNGGVLNCGSTITDGGGTATSTINFNGGTLQAGLSSATFITGLDAVNVQSGGATVDTNGFNITIANPILTTVGTTETFVKNGLGTLTLSAANTYTGATTVNGGTLAVNGSLAAASGVTMNATTILTGTGTVNGTVLMNSGSTLTGTGTYNGTTTFTGGSTLIPGNSGIGTITLNGNGIFNSAVMNYELGLPGPTFVGGIYNDLVNPASGTPNFDFAAAPGTLNVTRLAGFSVGTYTLMSGYNFLNAGNLPTVTPIAGVTMSTQVSGNTLLLNVTAVAPSASRVTWSGSNGIDHGWSNPANWGGTNIAVGGPYELYFPPVPANNDYISTDNIASLTIHSIVIESTTPYTIGGTVTALTTDGNGTNTGVALAVLSGSGHAVSTTPLVWSTSDQVISITAGSLSLSSNITNGAFNTIFSNAVDMTYSGVIGNGAGGLIKTGAGKLTLSGSNTYSGINTLGAGTVSVTAPANLGVSAAANAIFFPANDTGILQMTGAFVSTVKGVTLTGNGIFDVPTATDTASFTTTGVITGAGNMTKTGNGSLTVSTASTLTGSINLNAGTFIVGNATAMGPATSAVVNFGPASTATLNLNGNNVTVVGLNTNATVGTPIVQDNSGTSVTLTINNAAADTYAGVIQNGPNTGTLALTKGGAGTLTFSGTLTHTGNSTFNAGTTTFTAASTLNNPALLTVSGTSTIVNLQGTYTNNSATVGILISTGVLNCSGTETLTGAAGTVILGSIAAQSGTLNVTAGTFSFNKTGGNGFGIGNVSGGTGAVNVSGGTLLLAGNDVFDIGFVTGSTGIVTVSGTGVLDVGVGTTGFQFGNGGAVTGTLNLDGGTLRAGRALTNNTSGGTFNFNGGTYQATGPNATIGPVTSIFVKAGGAIIDTQANAVTITQTLLTDAVSTGGGLTKVGSGTLALSSSTYTGTTTVGTNVLNSGALYVNGTAAGAAYTVFGGIGGKGTIPSSITVNAGSVINPGDVAATGLLTLTAASNPLSTVSGQSSTLNFRLNGVTGGAVGSANNDGINASTGAVNLFITDKVNISGAPSSPSGSIVLIQAAPGALTVSGSSSAVPVLNSFPSYLTGATLTNDGTNLIFSYTGIAAGTKVWTGTTSNLWSVNTNWADGVTPTGAGTETLIFPAGASNISTSNDIAGTKTYASIQVLGGGYTLAASVATNVPSISGANALVVNTQSGNTIISTIMTGTGTITINAAANGTVLFSGVNTFTGNSTFFNITAGTILVNADTGFGNAPASVTPNHITLNGGGFALNSTAAQITVSATRGIQIGNSGGAISNLTTQNFLLPNVIANVAGQTGTLTYGNTALPLASGLIVPGSTTANTYSGGTILNPGMSMAITANSNAVFGSGTLTLAGGSLRPSTTAPANAITNAVTITADTTFITGGADNTLTFSGPVTLAGTGGVRTLTNNNTNTTSGVTFSNAIGDGGAGIGLTVVGSGTTVLSSVNSSYTGPTTISTTLTAGSPLRGYVSAASLGNSGSNSSLGAGSSIVFSGGTTPTLVYTGGSVSVNRPISLLSNGAIAVSTANSLTLTGLISGAGGLTFGVTSTGSIGATGTVVLPGSNTFLGNVTLTFGTLKITNSGAFGLGAKSVTCTNNAGGTGVIHLDGSGGDLTFPSTISWTTSGAPVAPGGVLVNDAGNNTINGSMTLSSGNGSSAYAVTAGSLTLNGNISPNATLRQLILRGAGNGTINGNISNGSTLNMPVIKDSGVGTWTLNGANTFTGGIFHTAGVIAVNGDAGLGGTSAVPGSLVQDSFTANTGQYPGTATVTISAPPAGGVQATATPILGVTAANFVLNANGSTYSTQPTVTISGGGGSGATGTVAAGAVLTITAAGTNFTTAPTLAFSGGTLTAGTGYTVTSTNATNFTIVSVTTNNAGSGYIANPTVNFSAATTGTAATATYIVKSAVYVGTTSPGATLRTAAATTLSHYIILTNSANFDTNGLNSTFSGVMAGTGTLTKIGTGALTFTGANTYTGATTINAGIINVGTATPTSTASLVSTVTVAGNGVPTPALSGNQLRGTGTVAGAKASDTANNNASIWPGIAFHSTLLTSNETLTVAGNVDLTNGGSTGGKLAILVRDTSNVGTANAGVNQVLAVNSDTATVTLGSGTVLSVAPAGTTSTLRSASPNNGQPGHPNLGEYVIMDVKNSAASAPIRGISKAFGTIVPNGLTYNAGVGLGTGNDFDLIYRDTLTPSADIVNPTLGSTLANPVNQIVVVFNTTNVTPVKLDSFTARSEGSGVLLEWHSVSEFQNAGYMVYRRAVGTGEWSKVNRTLIGGRLTNADEHTYSLYDWADAGSYEYRLQSISLKGELEDYKSLAGPVTVDVLGVAFDGLNDESVAAADDSVVAEADAVRVHEVGALFAAVPGAANVSEPVATATPIPDSRFPTPAVSLAPRSSSLAPTPFDASVGARWFSPVRASGSSSYSAAKVVYSAPGVLAITQASLPNGFDINHISITREGKTIPALSIKNGTLYAYAPGYSDDYTDKDALFLRNIAGNTAVSANAAATSLFGQPASTSAPATVTASFHDVYFDFSTNFRPYVETPWFSSQYLTDNTDQRFTVATPLAGANAATLTVNLWSLTTDPNDASPDHALQVVVNGIPCSPGASWTGGGKAVQLSFAIPAGALNASAKNIIELVTPAIPNVSGQIALLHSLVVNYTKSLDGSVPSTIVNTVNNQIYEIGNLTSGGAWVIDARFPDRASLAAVQMQGDTLRFQASSNGTGQYLVVPFGFENAPLSVTGRKVTALRSTTKYLAVGPNQFASGVQPLIAAHAKDGLRAVFVDQEQIFDYYGYGRYGPSAIQNAVRSTRPQYLLLVGRTTYDYHNYSGANVDPLCPAFLISTSFWAQTTADAPFGDFGRGYPEIAIGRLPVNDTADLSGAVNHILNYKGFPAASGITGQLTADIADPAAGDFAAQSDSVAAAHPDFVWQKNYAGVTAQQLSDVNTSMTAAANGGADLLVYVGHGNAARLGNGFPSIADTSSVQEWHGNVPLLQSTCTANWMAKNVQNYHSIAIQALTQPQGGISCSIGTSTYMNSDVAVAFLNQLLTRANRGGQRWGLALMQAQQWALMQCQNGFNADLGRTEQLFGDPAMPVFSSSRGNSGASSALNHEKF